MYDYTDNMKKKRWCHGNYQIYWEQVKAWLEHLGFLMPPYLLTNFDIQKYQNKAKFNGVYLRNDLLKIKDGRSIQNQ